MESTFQPTVEFIKSQFKTEEFIPLHVPHFGGNEKKYLMETIDSTFVSSVGAFVDQFEVMMQNITSAKKGIAVVNGTAGLQVALRLAGISSGDEAHVDDSVYRLWAEKEIEAMKLRPQ